MCFIRRVGKRRKELKDNKIGPKDQFLARSNTHHSKFLHLTATIRATDSPQLKGNREILFQQVYILALTQTQWIQNTASSRALLSFKVALAPSTQTTRRTRRGPAHWVSFPASTSISVSASPWNTLMACHPPPSSWN